MNCCFLPAELLLPAGGDFEKWAVIACDQFTSDKAYWDRVETFVGNAPSTLRLVLPEIYLEDNAAQRIAQIGKTMAEYQNNGAFKVCSDSFVYVERTLLDGSVRPGIVGMIDLEQYHYDPSNNPAIGATEQTVLERIPPRIAVRREATIEFPHVILFCNDAKGCIVEPVRIKKDQLRKLYDFVLMEDGGHIAGWLIDGENAEKLQEAFAAYLADAHGSALLVADGNHSLVTAKCWYEELKQNNPGVDLSSHPARYALVELENILDPSVVFEPIHRVLFDVDPDALLADLSTICCDGGAPVEWIIGGRRGVICLDVPKGELTVSVLQRFLDQWLADHPGKIDYIHDNNAVEALAAQKNAIGLLLPVFHKSELFAFGACGKILPRKSFSLGHGREKRYYLEGRRIK